MRERENMLFPNERENMEHEFFYKSMYFINTEKKSYYTVMTQSHTI